MSGYESLHRGMRVVITDALGEEHDALTLSDVEIAGHNFPVIWIQDPLSGDRIPWPVTAVRPAMRDGEPCEEWTREVQP